MGNRWYQLENPKSITTIANAGLACQSRIGIGVILYDKIIDMDDSLVREILNMKVVAVVGCSPNEQRASNHVARYLQMVGYKMIPVNPGYPILLGETCYPNLLQIPDKVEVVNIFRKSEYVFPIVQDAIKIGAKVIWMQDGVEHPLASETALNAGLKVVMNDCIMRQHGRLNGPFGRTITTC